MIQRRIRGWLIRQRIKLTEKSNSEDFLIRFYIRCIYNVARVTIMMVKLKATTIQHKRHIDKDNNLEVDHT
jgi:hypothetical protein